MKGTPQHEDGDNSDAPKSVALAPLLVFEDRGALVSAAPAVLEANDAPQLSVAAAGAPQRAPQIVAQNGVAAPAPPQLAQAGVAPAANVSGGLPPLSRLHEEVAAFAAAAWPTRVSIVFFFLHSSFSSSSLHQRQLLSLPPLPLRRSALSHHFYPVYHIPLKTLKRSQSESNAISNALAAVSTIATRLWPQSRTVLFGSQATGLSLPGGDLDIVILGVSHEMTNPALGFTR